MGKQSLNLLQKIFLPKSDRRFLLLLKYFEKFISKLLALCLVVVIFVSVIDLFKVLFVELRSEPFVFFDRTIIEIFGLFLNILIALELLENITVYLKENVIQVELVIVTAIIAVSRKIIIFSFSKNDSLELIALGFAIICLSVGFWMLKRLNVHHESVGHQNKSEQ